MKTSWAMGKHMALSFNSTPKSRKPSTIGRHPDPYLVSCPRNKRYFVGIKMGRRQGGPSRTGAKEAFLNTIPPSAIWLIFQGASDEHIEIRTREASSAAAGQQTGQRAI